MLNLREKWETLQCTGLARSLLKWRWRHLTSLILKKTQTFQQSNFEIHACQEYVYARYITARIIVTCHKHSLNDSPFLQRV